MEAFDRLMTELDPPMVVVTTAVDGERAGCLVGFHAQSSIDPSRYAVWISKANHTYRVARRASTLAVHFLGEAQHELAAHFGAETGDEVDKFAGLDVELTPEGVPLLAACPNRFWGRRVDVTDQGGDHVAVVIDPVVSEFAAGFRPLRLRAVEALPPGHDNDERA